MAVLELRSRFVCANSALRRSSSWFFEFCHYADTAALGQECSPFHLSLPMHLNAVNFGNVANSPDFARCNFISFG
jgi:hypothetical protein